MGLIDGFGAPVSHAASQAYADILLDYPRDLCALQFGHQTDFLLGTASSTRDRPTRVMVEINSIHYQGIATLGEGLRIEALAPDDVVEAVAADDYPIFAVQWHPEMSVESRVSQAVFSIFGRMLG